MTKIAIFRLCPRPREGLSVYFLSFTQFIEKYLNGINEINNTIKMGYFTDMISVLNICRRGQSRTTDIFVKHLM